MRILICKLLQCTTLYCTIMQRNRAMNTEKNKDLFLKQVEQILDGIKKDKEKVCVLLMILCTYIFCL